MESILNVANFIFEEYKKIANTVIDEMKLHKLLYFAQRECLAITNEPLFNESFEAWQYGPVCPLVRSYYTRDGIMCDGLKSISSTSAYIVKNVILQYGCYSSWKLSELSHKEISWKNARNGIPLNERCCKTLSLDDIRKDAEHVRPYDSLYDMYYDEFDDVEG